MEKFFGLRRCSSHCLVSLRSLRQTIDPYVPMRWGKQYSFAVKIFLFYRIWLINFLRCIVVGGRAGTFRTWRLIGRENGVSFGTRLRLERTGEPRYEILGVVKLFENIVRLFDFAVLHDMVDEAKMLLWIWGDKRSLQATLCKRLRKWLLRTTVYLRM